MEKTFGEFFKQKRLEKNLTQKQLANQLFVSESTVSKWEKNIAHPDITLLPKLAEILGVTEHELITASIDNKTRNEKAQAKKWRAFSMSWSLFFYIAYGLALIPCFICDLAINKSLTWFWIVLSALVLSFTFTNLPSLVKKHKLLILPASMFGALVLLIGVCCIYTRGDWFIIPVLSILLAFVIIFTPIYISKYKLFEKIRWQTDFVSVAICYVMLNILLIATDIYSVVNGYSKNHWYLSLGFPITLVCYLILSLMMCVRFLKINKLLKTSIILYLIDLLHLCIPFIKIKNKEISDCNIFKADLSNWKVDVTLEQNVHLIIFLSLLLIASIFLIFGLIKHFKTKKQVSKI
jgi:transcriptional regulator with XRE-family HTH domain